MNFQLIQKNIKVIEVCIKSKSQRFLWDTFNLKRWLKTNNIKPAATISLQNTNFRTNRNLPNFIYYHNSIPFSKAKWSLFSRHERGLWFYKHIYPFFVRLFINRNTEVFVQTDIIKEDFANFYGFSKDRIHVITPEVKFPDLAQAEKCLLDKNHLNLFYPATGFIYKNHKILIQALNNLEVLCQKQVTLHLTCERHDLAKLNVDSSASFRINFMGKISFSKVLGMYKHADALVFPSYIETLGLPLLEAGYVGMPIVVADLAYSHEVLDCYEGARFAKHDDVMQWTEEIVKLFPLKGFRFKPLDTKKSNSWPELFNIVKARIG